MESRLKFTVLDFEVRKALNLSGNDWIVFSFIYNFSKSGVNYNGSLNEMSKLFGLNYKTMFRVVHRLEAQEYISIIKLNKYINLGYRYYITKKVFDIAKNIEEQKSKNETASYQNNKNGYGQNGINCFSQNVQKRGQNVPRKGQNGINLLYNIYNNIKKEKKYFDMDEIDNYQVID